MTVAMAGRSLTALTPLTMSAIHGNDPVTPTHRDTGCTRGASPNPGECHGEESRPTITDPAELSDYDSLLTSLGTITLVQRSAQCAQSQDALAKIGHRF